MIDKGKGRPKSNIVGNTNVCCNDFKQKIVLESQISIFLHEHIL